jgi:AcrR family transcriptional regulator
VGLKKNLLQCEAEACTPRKSAGERVFETARDLFYHRGIRAVGVDEIVSQAGVTKPSLYRAYASKDELVAACLEQSGKESQQDLEAVLAAAPHDPREQLRIMIRYFADKIEQPGFRGCPLSNTAVEFPEPGHPGRTVLENWKVENRALIVGIARRLPARDPEALADGLVLVIEGAMSSHHIFGGQGPSAAMTMTADALIEAYL